jgi:hypothetical protein
MFWKVFFAVLAALIVYKFLGDARRGFLERRQISKTPCVRANYALIDGESLTGYAIDDYDTDDVFLWDAERNCEWRFSRYGRIESPRTWRLTHGDFASFLRTARNIELRRDEAAKDTQKAREQAGIQI